MVSSDLIDIEVILKSNNDIRSKMIVDQNDNIEYLSKRIIDVLEKFSKISGLSSLKAKNLQKKTDKGLINIKEKEDDKNLKIGDYLNSKDVIFFELEFNEIWLEVEMRLVSDNKKLLIYSYELKVQNDKTIGDLTKLLLKLAIKSWSNYIYSTEKDPDYYLLTHFKYLSSPAQIGKNKINIDPYFNSNLKKEIEEVNERNWQDNFDTIEETNNSKYLNSSGDDENSIDREMEDFEERVKDRFNFKSKIKCQVEFINFIDLYDRVMSRKFDDKKKSFKNNIKEFEKIVLRYEILSLNGVGKLGTIFWKCAKNDFFHDDPERLGSILQTTYSECVSRANSFTATINGEERDLSFYEFERKSQQNIIEPLLNAVKNKTYETEINQLKKFGFFDLINRYSRQYLNNNKLKALEEPNFKSFITLSKETSSLNSNHFIYEDDFQPFETQDEKFYNNSRKVMFINLLKICYKRPIYVVFVFLVMFIIYNV